MISEEQSLVLREKRVEKLQSMLVDMKKQILRKVVRMTQDSTSHRRQRRNRKILHSRVRKSSNFIKVASESFFTLMCNSQSLSITTEIDIIQKAEKFKKNVVNACQKMLHNIQEEGENEKQEKNSPSSSKGEDNEELQDEIGQRQNRASNRSRSKNYKTSNEATVSMMEWLLENFENPYPSHEQKLKMAKEGSITLNKVNNWFINARQRTVKSYFSRDS